jgi:hypothetical protein
MDAQTRRWFIALFIGIALFVIGMALHAVTLSAFMAKADMRRT